jgi:hypothetical protein
MGKVTHSSDPCKQTFFAPSKRRHLVERLTPRPVVALEAHTLATKLDLSRLSRGVLVVVLADFSAILEVWTLVCHPDASRLGACMYIHTPRAGWPLGSDQLSLVGSAAGDAITWRFTCPEPLSFCEDHPTIFLPVEDDVARFACPEELHQPVSLVPARWLAFAEPDVETVICDISTNEDR